VTKGIGRHEDGCAPPVNANDHYGTGKSPVYWACKDHNENLDCVYFQETSLTHGVVECSIALFFCVVIPLLIIGIAVWLMKGN
jgi:hypothetical protein